MRRQRPGTDLARVGRTAGFRHSEGIDLAAIERRRLQVWGTMAVLLLALSLTLALTSLWPQLDAAVLDPTRLRLAMVILSAAFTAYVFEKERALRRFTGLVLAERELRIRLGAETRRLHGLLGEVQAMGAALDLDRLLQVILSCAVDLSGAAGATLSVRDDQDRVVRETRGVPRERLDEAARMAAQVQRTGATVIHDRHHAGAAVVGVPIRSHGAPLGVLTVHFEEQGVATAVMVSTLEAFGSHAATAIANARRYIASRAQRPSTWRTANAWDELDALARSTPPPAGRLDEAST